MKLDVLTEKILHSLIEKCRKLWEQSIPNIDNEDRRNILRILGIDIKEASTYSKINPEKIEQLFKNYPLQNDHPIRYTSQACSIIFLVTIEIFTVIDLALKEDMRSAFKKIYAFSDSLTNLNYQNKIVEKIFGLFGEKLIFTIKNDELLALAVSLMSFFSDLKVFMAYISGVLSEYQSQLDSVNWSRVNNEELASYMAGKVGQFDILELTKGKYRSFRQSVFATLEPSLTDYVVNYLVERSKKDEVLIVRLPEELQFFYQNLLLLRAVEDELRSFSATLDCADEDLSIQDIEKIKSTLEQIKSQLNQIELPDRHHQISMLRKISLILASSIQRKREDLLRLERQIEYIGDKDGYSKLLEREILFQEQIEKVKEEVAEKISQREEVLKKVQALSSILRLESIPEEKKSEATAILSQLREIMSDNLAQIETVLIDVESPIPLSPEAEEEFVPSSAGVMDSIGQTMTRAINFITSFLWVKNPQADVSTPSSDLNSEDYFDALSDFGDKENEESPLDVALLVCENLHKKIAEEIEGLKSTQSKLIDKEREVKEILANLNLLSNRQLSDEDFHFRRLQRAIDLVKAYKNLDEKISPRSSKKDPFVASLEGSCIEIISATSELNVFKNHFDRRQYYVSVLIAFLEDCLNFSKQIEEANKYGMAHFKLIVLLFKSKSNLWQWIDVGLSLFQIKSGKNFFGKLKTNFIERKSEELLHIINSVNTLVIPNQREFFQLERHINTYQSKRVWGNGDYKTFGALISSELEKLKLALFAAKEMTCEEVLNYISYFSFFSGIRLCNSKAEEVWKNFLQNFINIIYIKILSANFQPLDDEQIAVLIGYFNDKFAEVANGVVSSIDHREIYEDNEVTIRGAQIRLSPQLSKLLNFLQSARFDFDHYVVFLNLLINNEIINKSARAIMYSLFLPVCDSEYIPINEFPLLAALMVKWAVGQSMLDHSAFLIMVRKKFPTLESIVPMQMKKRSTSAAVLQDLSMPSASSSMCSSQQGAASLQSGGSDESANTASRLSVMVSPPEWALVPDRIYDREEDCTPVLGRPN